LLSGSRGGLVALLVQSLLIGYLVGRGSRSRRSSRLKQFGFAVALMAVVIGGLVFIGGENTLTRVVDTAAQEDFTTSRLAIWGVTLDVIWKHLPFGAGFGAFQTAYTEFDPSSGVQRVAQAHNDYLQVLADGGVVGLAFGIGFLVLVWRRSVKALSIKDRTLRSIAVGAVSGIVAVLVHSLFDFVLHTMAVALMFTLLLAIVQAIEISRERIAEENESQESKSISVFPITRSS